MQHIRIVQNCETIQKATQLELTLRVGKILEAFCILLFKESIIYLTLDSLV